jgi:hypothetical protein
VFSRNVLVDVLVDVLVSVRNFQREKLINYLHNQILKHLPVDELSCAHYKQQIFYQTMLADQFVL